MTGGGLKKGKSKTVRHSMRIIQRNQEIKKKYEIKLKEGLRASVAKKQLAAQFYLSYARIENILYRED